MCSVAGLRTTSTMLSSGFWNRLYTTLSVVNHVSDCRGNFRLLLGYMSLVAFAISLCVMLLW